MGAVPRHAWRETRTVIVPSLPGFPGGDRGHTVLDSHLDWVLAVRELIDKAGPRRRRSRRQLGRRLVRRRGGGDLAGQGEAAGADRARSACSTTRTPPPIPWAQKQDDIPGLMTANPEIYKRLKEMPAGANSIEWPIEQTRAAEAAARIFWPLGNTKLERRLPFIKAPTLLLWGEQDRLMPRSYAAAIAKAIKAPTETRIIAGAGHLAELDNPDDVAAAILGFMG